MAAPNLLSLTTIAGKTAGLLLTNAAQDLIANAAASGKVLKLNSLIVANKDASARSLTISFVDASPAATLKLCYALSVPVGAAVNVIEKTGPLYLEEGDKLTGLAGANNALEAVWSYEEMS